MKNQKLFIIPLVLSVLGSFFIPSHVCATDITDQAEKPSDSGTSTPVPQVPQYDNTPAWALPEGFGTMWTVYSGDSGEKEKEENTPPKVTQTFGHCTQ